MLQFYDMADIHALLITAGLVAEVVHGVGEQRLGGALWAVGGVWGTGEELCKQELVQVVDKVTTKNNECSRDYLWCARASVPPQLPLAHAVVL